MYVLPLIAIGSLCLLHVLSRPSTLDDALSPEARARAMFGRAGSSRPEHSWRQW